MKCRLARLLFVTMLAVFFVPGCSGCDRREDDGTRPTSENLPKLELRDDTSDVLLTWIDDKGDHHVVLHPPDVPEKAREMVRVRTVEHGHGEVLYVADLRKRGEDGVYPVTTMARSAWELMAEQRRSTSMAALSPTAVASAGGAESLAPTSSQLTAVVYAASWCGACRSAEALLRRQGVNVVVKDIEKDKGAHAQMQQALHRAGLPKGSSIPVIEIRGRVVVGFDEREIRRVIRESTQGDML